MARSNKEIGQLEIVPIRDAFAHETYNFTTWLESHIEVLGERLNIELSVTGREQRIGDFVVDLVCEDKVGNRVVIENQLERTNHGHLGQLLTYLVNLEAQKAIWITTEPRPEHQRVVEWLNEASSTDVGFYLVKVEAARIGNSPYAALFTVLASPDTQTKEVGEQKREWADRHRDLYDFWEELLKKCNRRISLFSNISPKRYPWIGTGAGISGVSFNYSYSNSRGTAELYIDNDKQEGGRKNKEIFDAIFAHKNEIESAFGGPLEWERLDSIRASRIRKVIVGEGTTDSEKRANRQDEMIEAMICLHAALSPFLEKIEK